VVGCSVPGHHGPRLGYAHNAIPITSIRIRCAEGDSSRPVCDTRALVAVVDGRDGTGGANAMFLMQRCKPAQCPWDGVGVRESGGWRAVSAGWDPCLNWLGHVRKYLL